MEKLNQNIELMDFFKVPFTFFRTVGIRLIRTNEERPLREKLAFIVTMTNLVSHSILKNLYPFMEQFENPIEITAYAIYAGYMVNSFCKMIAVWNGRFILEEVVAEMEKIFPKTEEESTIYRLRYFYKNISVSMKSLGIYHIFTTTLFNFFPIAQSVFEFKVSGGDWRLRLPFLIYYPFDEFSIYYYPFVYLYQIMSSYILSCFFLGADLLLVTTVNLICMHFEYLANRITNFRPSGTDEDLKELGSFIRYHCNILDLSCKINEIFNIAILLNYMASCGVICMIGFQITVGSEILDLLKFFALLVSSLVHVYFICHFGSNLLNVSSDLSDAVFSHRWYLGNNKYKKMLVLIIARTHKPAFIMAFKFFIISMESFKTLVTTSYQFFTLIKTKYDGAE